MEGTQCSHCSRRPDKEADARRCQGGFTGALLGNETPRQPLNSRMGLFSCINEETFFKAAVLNCGSAAV